MRWIFQQLLKYWSDFFQSNEILNKKPTTMLHKYLLVITVLLSTFFYTKSQPNIRNTKQKIEAQKVAFMTRRLNLTVEEAQKFWPVYNEYMIKKNNLLKKEKALLAKFKNKSENLSDKELEKLADDNIEIQIKEANLAKIYHQKFKTVLPIKKVIRYYQAENQFKRVILNQYRKKNANQGRGR